VLNVKTDVAHIVNFKVLFLLTAWWRHCSGTRLLHARRPSVVRLRRLAAQCAHFRSTRSLRETSCRVYLHRRTGDRVEFSRLLWRMRRQRLLPERRE